MQLRAPAPGEPQTWNQRSSCTRVRVPRVRTCAQHALAQRRLRAYVLQKQFKTDIGVDRSETLENGGRAVFSVGAMEM